MHQSLNQLQLAVNLHYMSVQTQCCKSCIHFLISLVVLYKRNTTSVDNGTHSFITGICFILNVDSNDFRYNAMIFYKNYLIMSSKLNSQSDARDYALHKLRLLIIEDI